MDETDNINSPEMSESGEVTVRAITSAEQAYGIASRLEKANEDRNRLNAVILKKYNGGQPYEPSDLKANAEDWRSNAPTGFMSSIVDRITPSPIQAIDSARYLTAASLCQNNAEAEAKSEYFRQAVTKSIRRWNGWRDFLSSLFQELILIGYASPLNLNPYSPWPKMFKGDEVFYPDGTGQHAKIVPALSAKEDLLVHDFADAFRKGKEIAEGAGWNFENCIKVINDALPQSATSKDVDARKWEDAVREANVGASHSGAKIVRLYHTLAVEPDTQKITHYIVNRDGNHEVLFSQEDRFEQIEDVTTLFTLQPANGKYYASKGIGRMLLNLHISIERTRNGLFDNLYLAGVKIIKIPPNQSSSFTQRMVGPFMVVSLDGDFEQHGIEAVVTEFIEADNQISRWAEQLVGTYISGLRGEDGPDKTAHEAVIEANRDTQAKTAFLARTLGQLADLIGQITRRLCDPETTDQIAKDLQKELKDPERGNLTKEEIDELANAPAAEVVQDLTQMSNQQIAAVFPVLKGDPNIDQNVLYERFLAAAVNLQFSKDVLLTEQNVQANDIEAVRQQMGETEDILKGSPGVPVSPRDDHPNHLKTIFSDLKAGLPNIAKAAPNDPSVLDHLNAQLVHSGAHINEMKKQGAPPDATKPFEDAQNAFEGVLNHLAEAIKQSQNAPQSPVARPNAPAVSTPQATPPSVSTASPDSEPTMGGIPEGILKAWIGQYPNISVEARAALEKVSGLAANEEQSAPALPTSQTQIPQRIVPQPTVLQQPPVPSSQISSETA